LLYSYCNPFKRICRGGINNSTENNETRSIRPIVETPRFHDIELASESSDYVRASNVPVLLAVPLPSNSPENNINIPTAVFIEKYSCE
jgi:hypothetical protein